MPPARRRRRPSGSQSLPASPNADAEADRAVGPDMAPNADEPDHYSYEEMVDHLRKVRSSSESQNLKSKKKRRRRSQQPVRQRRRSRLVKTMVFLLVLLPILAFVVGSYVFSYISLKGESFRKSMTESVNEKLGVNGEFEDKFNITGRTLENRSYSAIGPKDSLVAQMDLRSLSARMRFTSMFSKDWQIDHLDCDEARIELRPLAAPAAGAAQAAFPLDDAEKANGPEILAAGLGFSNDPSSFDAERISFRDISFYFGESRNNVPRQIEHAHLVLNKTRRAYFGNCDLGILNYQFWPSMKIKSSDVSFYFDGKIVIHQASLETEDGGTCELTGEINPNGPVPTINLSAEIANFKLSNMVNPDTWGDRLLGRMNGEFTLEGTLTKEKPPVLKGKFNIPNMSLKNMVTLNTLSKDCRIFELKRVEFEFFEGELTHSEEGIRIHDFFGKNASLIGLSGDVLVRPNHTLEGEMKLGLPDDTLNRIANGRPDFFESGEAAFSWASFNVYGNLETPQDDLRTRFFQFGQGATGVRHVPRQSGFHVPRPLAEGPKDVYIKRLEQLFEDLSS